jgi:uncharacterized protein
MKIIDAHVHLTKTPLMGRGRLKQLTKSMRQNGVEQALVLADAKSSSAHYSTSELVKLCADNRNLKLVAGIDAEAPIRVQLAKYGRLLEKHMICGFKLYPGYQYFYPSDRKFDALYRFAEKHHIPVIIHSGDTFTGWDEKPALIKYSHPIHVDEAAVRFPKVTFVIAHAGNPWLMDAAEVIDKNDNVYADLSGLVEGYFSPQAKKVIKRRLSEMFDYLETTRRFIFGSDWPLIDLESYISFFKSIIPRAELSDFFYGRAKKIFHL